MTWLNERVDLAATTWHPLRIGQTLGNIAGDGCDAFRLVRVRRVEDAEEKAKVVFDPAGKRRYWIGARIHNK